MLKTKKILVTGAAGFTGRALALRLASEGYQVRGTIRPGGNSKCSDLTQAGVEIVEADIGSPDDCNRIVEGCAYIFNIAALFRRAGVPDDEYRRINRDAIRYLIEAAEKSGVEKMVHCSTIGVCGHIKNPPGDENTPYNPGDIYQITKMEGEQFALKAFREGRLRGTVIRPGSIYGPGDLRLLKLFRMIAKKRFIVVGDGKPKFHLVYIDDLVQGFIRGMQCDEGDGELFIIGGESAVPLNDLFKNIAKILEVKPPRWRIPAAPVQMIGSIVEKICIPFGIEPPIYRRRVDFFTKNREFDISKARSVLGYQPRITAEEGLKLTANWYLENNLI